MEAKDNVSHYQTAVYGIVNILEEAAAEMDRLTHVLPASASHGSETRTLAR
jgi:hypothetical protein